MVPAKLDILFAFTNYAGNGGIASTIPHLRRWWAKQFSELCKDPRIGRIADLSEGTVSNTPITMVRNKCLRKAIDDKFDILVFIDSDNCPDLYVDHDPNAKPFLQSSFDFLYKRLLNGVPTVIAAPYCGPPPHPITGTEENVYVFKWLSMTSDDPEFTGAKLEAYNRDEAALHRGIQPAGALPTGVCMIAVKALECLPPPYFRYEWVDVWEDEKASTEDVYFTRNVCMAGARKWGQPVVFCNWDSWAGHYKQKMVGKPIVMRADNVADVYAKAVLDGLASADSIQYIGFRPDGTVDNPPALEAAMNLEDVAAKFQEETKVDPRAKQVSTKGMQHWYIGWLTSGRDTDALLNAASLVCGTDSPTVGVEIGSWTGYTASLLMDKFPDLSLVCVDTFMGTDADVTGVLRRIAGGLAGDPDIVYSLFGKNMKRFGGRCVPLRSESLEAAKQFADETLDFVFIDANHSYEGVKADIEAWLPKVKPNGVICGHDYGDMFPGVEKAVREVFGVHAEVEALVWRVDLAKVGMSPSKLPAEVDDPPENETHAIVPRQIGEKVVECDDTLVTEEDRDALASLMRGVFGRIGAESRKLVYVGSPDSGTLAEMAMKGQVFCIAEDSDPRLQRARTATWLYGSIKFVRCESIEEAVYEPWWDDGDADLVFVHESSASVDVLQRALDLLKPDGILCGNGTINDEAFDGTPVGTYKDSKVWGIQKQEYESALRSNGKGVAV